MSLYRFALILLPLAASVPASAQSVLLRFKPPVGTKRTYNSTMTMTMSTAKPMPGMAGPMTFTMSTPMEMRIVKRVGSLTTMESKNGKPKVTIPANSPMAGMKSMMESQGAGMVTSVTLDEFGNMKSMSSKGGGQAGMMSNQMGKGVMSGLEGVTLPKGPVKVGETWTSSFDMGKIMGGAAGPGASVSSKKMPMTFRLASIESKGGKRVARISTTMKGTMKINANGQSVPITMNMSGYSLIEVETGLVVGTSMTSDSTFGVMGNTMKQHMVMSMTAR